MDSTQQQEQLIRLMTSTLGISPAEARGFVILQSYLQSVPAPLRAVQLKAVMPGTSDDKIAELVGIDRSTLIRSADYQRLKTCLKPSPSVRRGYLDRDGNIEACD